MISLMALDEIAQQRAEAAGLNCLELRLQFNQVIGERKVLPVAEVDVVGRINAAQVEMILHALAECGVGLGKDFAHEKERGPDVEAVPAMYELAAASARGLVLLEH